MTTKEKKGFRCRRSALVLAAVLTVLLAMSAIAYAATDGEVLKTVKIWINGKSVDTSVYTQEDGTIQIDLGELSESDIIKVSGEDWGVAAIEVGGEELIEGVIKVKKEGGVKVEVDINEAGGENAE